MIQRPAISILRGLLVVGLLASPAAAQVGLFQGAWANREPDEPGLMRVAFAGTNVRAWSRCGRDTCDLGTASATVVTEVAGSADTANVRVLRAVFVHDSITTEVVFKLRRIERLRVSSISRVFGRVMASETQGEFEFEPQSGSATKGSRPAELPDFEWPVPPNSTSLVLPDGLVVGEGAVETLGIAFARIKRALFRADLTEYAVYGIPKQDGFVVVTQMENIREDGQPLGDRYAPDPRPDRPKTLSEFLRALLHAPPGLYRIIVLVVTDGPIIRSGSSSDSTVSTTWLQEGLRYMPPELRRRAMPPSSRCEALVYEFKRPRKSEGRPALHVPATIPALRHLVGAGLWSEPELKQ